jgi:hypothetical protein
MARKTLEPKLVLCGEPGPAVNDAPCCREKGHEGKHYTWHQMPNDHLWVVTFDGENILHAQVEGKLVAEEVCAIVSMLEWWHEQKGWLPKTT